MKDLRTYICERRKWQQGFSALEILLVLVLIGVMLAVAIPLLSEMLYRYRVQTAATQLSVNLRFARNASVKRKVPFRAVINDYEDANGNTYQIEFMDSGIWDTVPGMDFGMPLRVIIQKCDPAGPIQFSSNGQADDEYEIDVRIGSYNDATDTWSVMAGGMEYRINVTRIGSVHVRCNKNCG